MQMIKTVAPPWELIKFKIPGEFLNIDAFQLIEHSSTVCLKLPFRLIIALTLPDINI